MPKVMQNLVVLMEPTKADWITSFKGANMCLNLFCIDEDAAFELSGIYYSEKSFVNDEKVIDSAFAKIVKSDTKKLETHFIYADNQHFRIYNWIDEGLKTFILDGMQKYGIKKVMVTKIRLSRRNLITKEKMENYCKGEENEKLSVNDDLESLFDDIRLGKKPDYFGSTYFLPKLTKEELKLVERKDHNFMDTLLHGLNADVNEAEMKLSESDSKFVQAHGWRKTYTIKKRSKLLKLLTCSSYLTQ